MYHALSFTTRDEASAFIAALSRFLSSPAGVTFGSASAPLDGVAAVRGPAGFVTVYMNGVVLDALHAAFGVPESVRPCREADVPSTGIRVFGAEPRVAYGKDDILALLTATSAD